MTLTEIKALSDRELDAKLAEIFFGFDPAPVVVHRGSRDVMLVAPEPPHLRSSLDAIAPLESKTVEKFGMREYARLLAFSLPPNKDDAYPFWYPSVTASARHRAEACLYLWTQK